MDDFFRWQPAPAVPPVLVRWDAMAGIERGVLEGYKALPRRGAEVGGALLGRRDPASGEFVIDGFEPIVIEYQSGPSYTLSARDFEVWRDRVAELRLHDPGFIGIYRSQTRPGMTVTAEDCAMVERFLPREEGVLLLLKPLSAEEAVGAFFCCDGGAVLDEAVAAREFPLGRPAAAPPRIRRKVPAWVPLSAAAAGIAMGSFVHFRDSGVRENPVDSTAVAAPEASPDLHLRAEPNGSNARIAWDPASGALDGATGATLNVADGYTHKAVRLTSADLRNGYVEWSPGSSETVFEMSVERPGQQAVTASTRYVRPQYAINSPLDTGNAKTPKAAPASSPAYEKRGVFRQRYAGPRRERAPWQQKRSSQGV